MKKLKRYLKNVRQKYYARFFGGWVNPVYMVKIIAEFIAIGAFLFGLYWFFAH